MGRQMKEIHDVVKTALGRGGRGSNILRGLVITQADGKDKTVFDAKEVNQALKVYISELYS